MNLIIIFLTILFLFLIVFGGTILGKLIEDARALHRESIRDRRLFYD